MDHQAIIAIDLRRVFLLLKQKFKFCVIGAILCGLLVPAVGKLLVTPQYQAELLFYVNNSAAASQSVSASDIEASKHLADACGILLKTKATMEAVNDDAGLYYTYEDLWEMIEAENVQSTELLQVTVLCPSAQDADLLIKSISEVLPQRTAQVMKGVSLQLADRITAGKEPVSPNLSVYALMGLFLGGALLVAAVFLWAAADQKLRMREDIEALCTCPVLELGNSGGGDLFRAKLPHAIKGCPVIGISGCGAQSPELAELPGKILAATKKQILIVDCTQGTEDSGLSEILNDQISPEECIGFYPKDNACQYISCGKTVLSGEALGGSAMEDLLSMLKGKFDVIFLLLPEWNRALFAAPLTDGFLLTVRKGNATKAALRTAVQDLKFVGAKLNAVLVDTH